MRVVVRGEWKAGIDDGAALPTANSVVRLGALATTLLALSGCSDSCENSPIRNAGAPGGLHTAVMFNRNCGATTGFSTQISVLAKGQQPTDGGNTFVADTDHGAAASGEWGGPWAEISWLALDHLLIRYAAKSRVFHQVGEVSGVRVSYQPLPLPPLRMTVSYIAPETCHVSFEGRRFDLRTQADAAIRSLQSRAGHREAIVDGQLNVPWRCLGGAIAVAQRANYRASIDAEQLPQR
jgi:hypothetical protein